MKDEINWKIVKIAGWCITAIGGFVASVAADQIKQKQFAEATDRYLEKKLSTEEDQGQQ